VSDSVRVFAPAKINLFLHVGDRRADGFHALQSLVVFAEVGDELELRRSATTSLSIQGPFAEGLDGGDDNLVLKAARLMSLEAAISLTKNLPVASGIGGGSADAAAALRGLAQLWSLKDGERLARLAAPEIGSDVPVCVDSKPAWMEGRGEILTPVAGLPAMPMLLVNPGVSTPTAKVFRALQRRRGATLAPVLSFGGPDDLLAFLRATGNDLEAPAIGLWPVIGETLTLLSAQRGALLTRMSGSGATCFGLFERGEDAERAANVIALAHADWWVRATRIAQ
jgi:4-diphosphocytidyl-2-C-methyl-D-erythritol kinase